MTTRTEPVARRRPLSAPAVLSVLVALAVGIGLVAPASAAPAPGPPAAGASIAPAVQASGGDPSAGPYEPGFVDEPLPANPPSTRLDDLPLDSAELDTRTGDLDAAEGRRDDAADHLAATRQHLVDLEAERVRLGEELIEREATVVRRGEERQAAAATHARRVVEAADAAVALDEARDLLRELVVAAYVSESSAQSDLATALTGTGAVDDAVLRLALGDGAAAGRVGDVEQRTDALATAEARRDAARDALEAAREAERRAVDARDGTEQAIVDNATAADEGRRDEQDAVAALAERDRDVVVATAAVTPARLRADIVADGVDFPLVALDAWVKAAAGASCRVEWWMLAGISRVEGAHGTYGGGQLGARGYPSVKIIGPRLDGRPGFARIGDTDGGRWDGDTTFDRAVGPMQFIPSTWARWGVDVDGDGVADPFTIYDAAGAAADYLCHGRTDLTQEAQLRAAYFSYNHSDVYVAAVLDAAHGYRAALTLPPP